MQYQLILVGACLLILAVLAQLRAARIRPPPPIAQRVTTTATWQADTLEVAFTGARGIALSFHGATWHPAVTVLEVSGPLTLVSPRDVRRYVLARPERGPVELRHVWEQLTLRQITISLPTPSIPTPAIPTPAVGGAGARTPRHPASTEGVAPPASGRIDGAREIDRVRLP